MRLQLADMFMVKIASRTRSDRLTNGRHCANVNAGSSFNLLHVGEARSNSDVTRFRAEDKVTKGVCADRWCFHCDKLWFDAVSKLPRFFLTPPSEQQLRYGRHAEQCFRHGARESSEQASGLGDAARGATYRRRAALAARSVVGDKLHASQSRTALRRRVTCEAIDRSV